MNFMTGNYNNSGIGFVAPDYQPQSNYYQPDTVRQYQPSYIQPKQQTQYVEEEMMIQDEVPTVEKRENIYLRITKFRYDLTKLIENMSSYNSDISELIDRILTNVSFRDILNDPDSLGECIFIEYNRIIKSPYKFNSGNKEKIKSLCHEFF